MPYWIGIRSDVNFSIQIKASAARELGLVRKQDRARIIAAIDRLADNPFRGTALKGDLRGLRRFRVGEFRIIYEVQKDALVLMVVRVGRRKDVYRRRPR